MTGEKMSENSSEFIHSNEVFIICTMSNSKHIQRNLDNAGYFNVLALLVRISP